MKTITYISLWSVLILSSCINQFEADGPIETQIYDFGNFEGIDLDGAGDVFIYYGQTCELEVSTHSDLYPELDLYVKNGILHLGLQHNFSSVSFDKLQYKITLPELHYTSIDGSGNINIMDNFAVTNDFAMTIDGSGDIMTMNLAADRIFAEIDGSGTITTTNIDCYFFNANIDGAGKIRSQGYAHKQNIELDGSGDIDTDYLETQETLINIDGSGKCEVWAQEYLNVRIDGSGKVYYFGNPVLSTRISGSGKIIHLRD